jgi:hypothetical protein
VAPYGYVASELVIAPSKGVLDLLVALLDPHPNTIEPNYLSGARGGQRDIGKCCGSALDHAATFRSSLFASLPSTNAPFSNFAPALTNATR